jgi:hypothetical protein
VVAEREQELQKKEEEVTNMLEHGDSELSSREADLDTREATLEVEQQRMGELHEPPSPTSSTPISKQTTWHPSRKS